jgi:hypothetical protein
MTQTHRARATPGRRRLARLAIGALVLALLNSAFLLVLVLVQQLDGAPMEQSLRRSAERGQISLDPWPQVRAGPRTFTLDQYTDCIAYSTAIDGPEPSPLRRAVEARILSVANPNPCEHLLRHLTERAPWTAEPYLRYWHGYQAVLRPLLRHWDVGTVRRVNYALAGAAAVAFAAALFASLPWTAAAALLALLIALTDALVVPLVTAHVAGMVVTLLTCTAALLALRRPPDENRGRLLWIALVSGAVFNFVDFLVNPPFAPTLLAFLALATWTWHGNGPGRGGRGQLREATLVVATWFAAYAATWAAKWAVAAAILGPSEVLGDVLYAAQRRTTGDVAGAPVQLGAAAVENFAMIGWTPVAAVAIVTAAALALLLARYGAAGPRLARFGVLCAPALIPLLWLETLRSHSVEHALFTYRSAALSLVLPLVAVTLLWSKARRERSRDAR